MEASQSNLLLSAWLTSGLGHVAQSLVQFKSLKYPEIFSMDGDIILIALK